MSIPNFEKRSLLLSNYGRWLGWDVLQNGAKICRLSYHSPDDQFWDCYVLSEHAVPAEVIERDEFWNERGFQFVSHACPAKIVTEVICRWSPADKILSARGLYVQPREITYLDRLRIGLELLMA